MSASSKRESPRRRCRRLVKRGESPSHALLMPIVHTVAAQIEGLEVREFLSDATKLSKCLTALQQSLDLDAMLCFVDAGAMAEALGAQLDWACYPPKIRAKPGQAIPENIADQLRAHVRIRTGVEVLKRLGTTVTDDVLFALLVTGPATLAAQMGEAVNLEQCGRIVSEAVRVFGEAGADIIIVEEKVTALEYEEWAAALLPAVNVTRFYNALPVLLPTEMSYEQVQAFSGLAPGNLLICSNPVMNDKRLGGQILSVTPDDWDVSGTQPCLVTTAGELPPASDIPELHAACRRIRGQLYQV